MKLSGTREKEKKNSHNWAKPPFLILLLPTQNAHVMNSLKDVTNEKKYRPWRFSYKNLRPTCQLAGSERVNPENFQTFMTIT